MNILARSSLHFLKWRRFPISNIGGYKYILFYKYPYSRQYSTAVAQNQYTQFDTYPYEESPQTIEHELQFGVQEQAPITTIRSTSPYQTDEISKRTATYYEYKIYNALSDGRISDVFLYCTELKQAGLQPSLNIMNIVIEAFAITRKIDMAFIMFDQMLEMKLFPDRKTLNALLKACDVHNDTRRADLVIAKFKELELYPDLTSRGYLVSMFAKSGNFSRAWYEYLVIKASYSAIPKDLATMFFRLSLLSENEEYSHKMLQEVIAGCARYASHDIYKALMLFLRQRYLNGCTFITESYTNNLCEGQLVAVMVLASRAKDIEKCNELFNRIISTTKNQPSQFAINAYLYFCVANRLPLTFLDTVNQYTVKLSPTFAGFFSSMCSTEEDINSAYNHLWTSFQQEKCVTMDAFDALIRACAQSGNMPRAMSIFADCLNEFKLTPEIGSFNGLIEACAKTGDVPSALSVKEKIVALGRTPNLDTYKALIQTCVNANDLKTAVESLREMFGNKLVPTYQICHSLAIMCAKLHDFEEANSLLNFMYSIGMIPEDSLIMNVHPSKKDNIVELPSFFVNIDQLDQERRERGREREKKGKEKQEEEEGVEIEDKEET